MIDSSLKIEEVSQIITRIDLQVHEIKGQTIGYKYFFKPIGLCISLHKIKTILGFCYFFEVLNIPNLNRVCLFDGSNPLVNVVLEGDQFRAGMFVNMHKR